LFQTISANESQLQSILHEELDYFTSVLQFSQKFLKQVKSLPVSVLADMVNYRQEWIDKIQNLEERRRALNIQKEDAVSAKIIQKISKTAEKLVKIDERIYENLQQRKLKFVKEHADVVSETTYTKKQTGISGKASKILDIVQE